VGHWLGDNFADWDHYRWTIGEIQEFAALFQVPMVGSDICGYDGVTTDNLCSRWVFLGAFSPFFRDHSDNSSPPHELYRTAQIAAAARAAIDIRYRLLDYAYTAMWTQTQTGAPMINPMFFEYPSDSNTANLPYQYFWGDSIMVAPVTDEDSTSVSVYFPKDQFYDFYTGAPVTGKGSSVTLTNIGFDTIPLYFKGGSIVPMRVNSANTTAELRQQNFAVVIAPNSEGTATGQLYLDEGNDINQPATSEIQFTYVAGEFVMTGKFGYNPGNVVLSTITLLGAHGAGRGGSYDSENKVATYHVNAKLTGPFTTSLI
jgi:alpha-glucosidase